MPHLEDQVINRYLKEICKDAGIDDMVEIEVTNGGTPKKVWKPKYELVHTHTARRTGATLMYLSGMDIYDIMKITGHTSPAMLRKYIKAEQLKVVEKICVHSSPCIRLSSYVWPHIQRSYAAELSLSGWPFWKS